MQRRRFLSLAALAAVAGRARLLAEPPRPPVVPEPPRVRSAGDPYELVNSAFDPVSGRMISIRVRRPRIGEPPVWVSARPGPDGVPVLEVHHG